MKLNIAFYTDSYLPATDGVVTSILGIKKELESRGHNVYIFSTYNISAYKKKYSNRKVFLYPGFTFKQYPQYNVAIFPYSSMMKLRNIDADLVHVHTPFMMGFAGVLNARALGKPLIGSFHTLINNKELIMQYYPKNKYLKEFTGKYLWSYVTFFYKRCDLTIAPSEAVRKILLKDGVERTEVIPNGVDLKIFNPKANGNGLRQKLGIKSNEKMVLYIGRLSREKKLEVLLKAAKILSRREDMKVVIGGSGPAEMYYKSMALRLGLSNVIFMGNVPKEMLPKLYAASDVFCLPSTFETQGIVSIEAMATGKPVVCADFMALRDLVIDGTNGEKFESGNYVECARKIEKVLNNPKPYIKHAVNTAMKFSTEKVATELIDVYKKALENRRFTGGEGYQRRE